MDVPYRPLGIIVGIVERLGLEVTYAYENLVFVSHNAFTLRVGSKGERVHLYFNTESDVDKRDGVQSQLIELVAEQGVQILNSGTHTIEPREDEPLQAIHRMRIGHGLTGPSRIERSQSCLSQWEKRRDCGRRWEVHSTSPPGS